MNLKRTVYRIAQAVGLAPLLTRKYLEALAARRGVRLQVLPDAVALTRGPQKLLLAREHLVYGEDMINHFDYYFNGVEPERRDGGEVVDYSRPRRHRLKGTTLDFVFTSLPESEETTVLYTRYAALAPGHVVLDLGAYCGASTHAFSRLVGPTGRVLAFEPDPRNFQALTQNIQHHQLANVTAVPQGVWEKTAQLSFQGEGNMGSAIAEITGRTDHTALAKFTSLDDAAATHGLTRVDFIKMDIEGAEVNVIRGAGEFFRRFQPRLMIEPHWIGNRINSEQICEALHAYGYRTETVPQADLHLPLIFAVHGER